MKCLAIVIALCACGGSSGSGKTKGPGPKSTPDAVDAGPKTGGPNTPAVNRLSSEECAGLFEHIFKIAIQAQRETLSAEEQPNEADIAKAKDKMRRRLMADCQKLSRKELNYDCYIKAENRGDIGLCDCRARSKSEESLATCECHVEALTEDEISACKRP